MMVASRLVFFYNLERTTQLRLRCLERSTRRSLRIDPYPNRGGQGIAHCCDGICEQPLRANALLNLGNIRRILVRRDFSP
jgi:hypothetical protein